MSALRNFRGLTAGVALLAASSVAQADFIDTWINGFYEDTNTNARRGLGLHYIPVGPEIGVLFAAYYTYSEDDNEPIFVQGAQVVQAGDYSVEIPIEFISGGSFGNEDGNPQATDQNFGTATFTLNSCNSATWAIQPGSTQFTGFSNEFDSFFKFGAPVDTPFIVPTSECVYQREFQGCPSWATSVPGEERGCAIEGEITESVTLTNDTLWFGIGRVYVGNSDTTDGSDNEGTTLTIEPGTRIIFGADGNPDAGLFVQMGAKINAQGTRNAPIVMTGPLRASEEGVAPQQWGGLIVHGRAPVNVCDTVGCATNEVDSSRYGGDDAFDSSGVIRYVRVQFGGGDVDQDPERQYNGVALHGVGAGTVVENVQVHANLDDAFEWFGGTVNARNLVATDMGDDGLDWVQGWQGRVQNVLVVRTSVADSYLSGDPRIIEADNLGDNNEAAPRSKPWIANGTFLSTGDQAQIDGAVLRRGTGANITNSLFLGGGNCFDLRDTATYEWGGTPSNLSGNLTINNSVVGGCSTNFVERADGTYTAQQWFDAQQGNAERDLALAGVFLPDGEFSSGFEVPYSIFDSFFQNYDWIGAFQTPETAWTQGWTLQNMDFYGR